MWDTHTPPHTVTHPHKENKQQAFVLALLVTITNGTLALEN